MSKFSISLFYGRKNKMLRFPLCPIQRLEKWRVKMGDKRAELAWTWPKNLEHTLVNWVRACFLSFNIRGMMIFLLLFSIDRFVKFNVLLRWWRDKSVNIKIWDEIFKILDKKVMKFFSILFKNHLKHLKSFQIFER